MYFDSNKISDDTEAYCFLLFQFFSLSCAGQFIFNKQAVVHGMFLFFSLRIFLALKSQALYTWFLFLQVSRATNLIQGSLEESRFISHYTHFLVSNLLIDSRLSS